ncbi:RNA polymerase sigma factor, sigma-70 family [Candidatus Scalindua japonica]|uniref:RNA polymerase sigma factor, sigma-70 family n=1 Tax=Candidatus Scalindua japonica TaxID=1284222 RepID=A0A286TVP7_9BACT|nr:RNA polymerase sigma factor [Candidatus Scalindua japonica]GAX59952.1 RNA polymerase sigma factor, sigma-70 family [Candidatus Scalindua japonica]
MENPEYTELVKLAKDGDSTAFENLVEQNYLLVYKISYNWCRAKEDAEDITQEVFVKLAKKIFSFNEESTFQTWLYRIVINTAKDYKKKQERKRIKEMKYKEAQRIKSESLQESPSNADKIHQLFELLPTKLRDTALLVFTEGLTHKEAAVVLNCAEKTISWRIHQVKKELKRHLEHGEVI